MAQAFSEKAPEEGKSRLRCPGHPESETVRSQMEGARAFSIGTFQAIRNPAHHLSGDWNPALAFHYLAALSHAMRPETDVNQRHPIGNLRESMLYGTLQA